jgi:hypothetical protein
VAGRHKTASDRSTDVIWIDTAVLDLTEWCCRRFQRLTGRTNVWLAVQLTNLSIIVYFVWAGIYFLSGDIGQRVALALFCGGLLYLLTQTIFKEPVEAYENNAYRRVAKGLRNPRRIRDALLRISFLTLSLLLFYPVVLVYINLRFHIAVLSYSLIVLTTVVLYLLACDPLPPCPGTVREWLRGSVPSRLAPSEPARRDTRSGQDHSADARGFSHLRPGNLAKSASVEHSVRPCSMASAARCASGTRRLVMNGCCRRLARTA